MYNDLLAQNGSDITKEDLALQVPWIFNFAVRNFNPKHRL
jgi:hypothetical protein